MFKPIRVTFHTDSSDMFEIMRDRMNSRSPDFIGGMSFMCTSVTRNTLGVNAELQECTRVASTWSGEGTPPVGTVCEFMKHNSPPAPEGQWTTGDVRYVSDCTVIIGGDKCEHVHHPRNCSFRPVRTPEQIAADARIAAIAQMIDDTNILTGIMSGRRIMAGQLYDAGYRKTDVQ